MASPFTVFRKNQKVMLAITGILAMIAFVFLGTCIQSPGQFERSENPVVVSWNYGDIQEIEMDNHVQMRKILNQFITEAAALAGQQAQPPFSVSEEDVIRSMVLARRGRDLGLVISDEMVNGVLADVTRNRLRPAEFEAIAARYGQRGQRLTAKHIFDALREELLALHVERLFLEGLGVAGANVMSPPDTPAQRWEHFRRLERQATAQVLPVPVAEFTEDVGKPSEEELQAMFEKYKNQTPSPGSPEPGFRQPYRAQFQYFKAEIDELMSAEMERIPEEEVREYYEKNKDAQFGKTSLSPLEGDQPDAKGDQDDVKDDDADPKPADSQPADDGEKPSATGEPGSTGASDSKAADDKPAVQPDRDAPVDKSSQTSSRATFQLASFQDEKGSETPTGSTPDKADGAGKASADNAAADSQPDSAKPESPIDSVKDAADAATTDEGAKEDSDPKPADPVEYRPLEQVDEEIRRTLARERVEKEVEKQLADLRSEMNRYAELRKTWLREAVKNPDEPKPKPLDLESLAEKHAVRAFSTELISRVQAANRPDLEITKSVDLSYRSPQSPLGAEWTDVAFQQGDLYRPRMMYGLDGNRYLWWKTDEREERTPQFKEARAEVLQAWKQIKARDLARKKAEEYAKTVRQAQRPMAEVFAQDKNMPVKEVGPFSWLTRANIPFGMTQQLPPVYYPDIPGVENPADDFMETTFNLKAGQAGIAFNHPKTIAYVIQAVKFEPSDAVLEQEFMVRMRDYERYRPAGRIQIVEARNDWMDSLLSDYGVQWHRPADIHSRRVE